MDEKTSPDAAPMPPSVGRIVHFLDPLVGKPPVLCAAIITEVIPALKPDEETLVGLYVFPPDGSAYPISNVAEHRGSGIQPERTWCWPVRVA